MTYSSLLILSAVAVCVCGHGRVLSPAGRSTAWRMGFNTTANFDDAGNFCGGFYRHYYHNRGKCGICGDSYDQRTPRNNELGGKYGSGVIVATYRPSSVFTAVVQLTAFHKGYWEFKLCPDANRNDQECFDQNILELQNGQGTKFYPTEGEALYHVNYRLPLGVTCRHCVLQWRYIAGNNYSSCKNGTGAIGCGNQEHFLACSDIRVDRTTHVDNQPTINYKTLNFMPSRMKQVFATEKYPNILDGKDDEDYVNDINVNKLLESKEERVSPVKQSNSQGEMNNIDSETSEFSPEYTKEYENSVDNSDSYFLSEDSEDLYDIVEETEGNSDNKAISSTEHLKDVFATNISDSQNVKNEYSDEKNCNSKSECYKDVLKKQSYDQNIVNNHQYIVPTNEVSPDFLRNVPYVCMPYVKWALSQPR